MNKDYLSFRNELSQLLGLIEWNPSQHELLSIAKKICERGRLATTAYVLGVVKEYSNTGLSLVTEGEDHSDLTLLLALATKVK